MSNTIMTLENAIQNFDKMDWDLALFVPINSQNCNENTPVMILDPDDVEDGEEEPIEAKEKDFRYLLTVSDFQSIMENVLEQKRNADIQMKLQALNHYLQNDAFITI